MRACFSSNAALRCCSAAALASSAAVMRASALLLISSFFLAVSSACRHTANHYQSHLTCSTLPIGLHRLVD